jgi:hypothetical protein
MLPLNGNSAGPRRTPAFQRQLVNGHKSTTQGISKHTTPVRDNLEDWRVYLCFAALF